MKTGMITKSYYQLLCASLLVALLGPTPVAASFPPSNKDIGAASDPTLTWNTFLGGSLHDTGGNGIALDEYGNIFVAGSSWSAWGCSPIPCTVRDFTEGTYTGYEDGFVAKLDPSGVLLWNTFLGGSLDDHSYEIALDSNGNVYVAGWSAGEWGCVPSPTCGPGGSDAYVAKLNGSDGALQWTTFFRNSVGSAIVVDSSGNIYLAGKSLETRTCSPVPCTARPYSGGWDGLVAKLNSSGELLWNTYLGAGSFGLLDDAVNAIAVDDTGNVYVEGDSEATWEAPVRPYNPGDGTGLNDHDAFAAKLNSSDGALQWNTFLGGSGDEWGWNEHFRGIAVDGDGNVYAVGDSTVAWGCTPVACTVRAFTPGSPFEANDAYVARLSPNGELQWNTFLGGDEDDAGRDIAVDGGGNVYVVGESDDTWGSPQRAFLYGDAFAAKLNSSGALQWNTFLGGNGEDRAMGLALDAGGNVYVAGTTDDVSWGVPKRAIIDDDVFAAKVPPPPVISTRTLRSISAQDGWVLERSESSGTGLTKNNTLTTFRLGDDAAKRQYRTILSFNTGPSLPDTATITAVTLKIRRQGIIGGGNPIISFQGVMVDLMKGTFGTAGLEANDFQVTAAASKYKAFGPHKPVADAGGWYSITLPAAANTYINKLSTPTGVTQIRLRFKLDDNNNGLANYLSLFSGNAPAVSQPQLIVQYYVP
jgi:hypothetical protein